MTDAFKIAEQLATSLGLVLTKGDYDNEMTLYPRSSDTALYKSDDLDVINAFLLGWTACLSRR